MKTNSLFKTLIIAALISTAACSDDDDSPEVINEEEVITTVTLDLENSLDPNDVVTLTSTDLDGDGPNAPVLTVSGPLTAGASYIGDIEFLNESETPVDNITLEVAAEDDEHEVFYISSISDLTVTKDDTDGNGDPLGLEYTVTTGNTATGTLTVVLRHEPTKPNDGSLTDAGGETDVQATFNIEVQ